MISQIYPNKYETGHKRYYTPPVVVPHHKPPVIYPFPHTALAQATVRAARLNITTMEWQRRDAIVRKMSGECKYNFMDVFYPPTLDDYITYGKCVYLGKPQSYAECDGDEWPTNDAPLLFSAQSLGDDGEKNNFFCNLAFMQKEMPKV